MVFEHHLLKPCTETQIIDCIQEVTKDYYKIAFAGDLKPEQDSRAFHNLHKTLIRNMIREGISCDQVTDTFLDLYEHYINLTDVPYQFCSVYYLEEKNLAGCLEQFDDYCREDTCRRWSATPSTYRMFSWSSSLILRLLMRSLTVFSKAWLFPDKLYL